MQDGGMHIPPSILLSHVPPFDRQVEGFVQSSGVEGLQAAETLTGDTNAVSTAPDTPRATITAKIRLLRENKENIFVYIKGSYS